MHVDDDTIYLAGNTNSRDFPLTAHAYDKTYNGGNQSFGGDVFVTRLAFNIEVDEGPVHNLTLDRQYQRIQHALLDAEPNNVIQVAPGLYQESLELSGKDVHLQSRDPNDPFSIGGTLINGQAHCPVLTLNDNSAACAITGVTLRAGLVGIEGSTTYATIHNCRIMDNLTHGLELSEESSPHLDHCLITANGQTGITMHSTGGRRATFCQPTIEDCVVVQNGTISIDGGQPVIVDSLIAD
jgi:hypothetical protein